MLRRSTAEDLRCHSLGGGDPEMSMLYVLSFIACLNGQADGACRQVEIAWEGSVMQCMLFGQQEAARWIATHPGYVMRKGYRCVPGREI